MSFKMEISSDKFKKSVKTLLNLVETNDKVLHEFLRLPDITAPDILKILNYLGSQLLDPQYTENIGIAFQDCILLIVTSKINNEDEATGNFELYQKKCIALSKLMSISPDILRYATKYFTNKPSPFQPANDENSIKKKAKLTQSQSVTDLEIAKCCYQLLSCDPVFFKDLWNWSQFVSHYLNQGCDLQKLYCNHAIAIITHMTPHQLKELNKSISEEVVLLFHKEQKSISFKSNPNNDNDDDGGSEKITDSLINVPFASEVVTNVEGVFLPIFNNENKKFYEETDGNYDTIVRVDSTKVNLRSIALGVSSGKAVCLSGPVGCGKTTLVEYLARKTGRICPKKLEIETLTNQKENKRSSKTTKGKNLTSKKDQVNGSKRKSDIKNEDNINVTDESFDKSNGFLRIQLGDQTDSKMLLGQYRCTDVPGEFIWLPGVLTQAVMNGYWLLLEDLDSATQDTYTILNNLLENNFLSVPGFRDCVKIEPGFQLFVTIRTNKGTNASQKCLYSLLEKYLYTINVLPLSRNELCRVVSTNYPKLSTVANRIVDVFLTFSSGDHTVADNLRTQESDDKADTTEKYVALPFEAVSLNNITNSGRLVSTRDLIKLCGRSNPMFSVTSTECAYFVFQNAVDVFCSYLPEGREKTRLVTSIGAKLGIIQSRCEFFADEYKPEVQVDSKRIKVGRAELVSKSCGFLKPRSHHHVDDDNDDFLRPVKKQKLEKNTEKIIMPQKTTKSATFSFTRMASCLLERISVCVGQDEPVLLVGETGVGKTSSVQYLAEKTHHKLVVVNMNNQSDVSDLVGGFKPVDINYVVAPLRSEFENLFRKTFDGSKNETFLNKFSICYNQGNFEVLIKLMITVVNSVFSRYQKGEFKFEEDLPKWKQLQIKLQKLDSQLTKSINISFAFIPGSLVNCIKNGDWVLLDEINLASAETLECLSTILEPDGSVVLLEKGDFTPVKRHPDFRIFACMNPNTDIGKKDLPVGIRNRFTEFFVDELTTDGDLTLLVSDYLSSTGIEKKRVTNIVKMYKKLRILSRLELNDGLGNRPVFSLRTLCRSLRICAKNLCGSIERNLYESFCMSFLTQLDPTSHNIVLELIKGSLLSNVKAILSQGIPRPGDDYLNFEGYWIQKGPKEIQDCSNYILTKSVGENLKDLSRIISIGKLPILLQGPTSAGKTSLIEYVAKKSGNHCLRINNHEHTDLQEYIGTYTSDVSGKLSFKEGVLVQAMRNGFWIILDELNLASTDILEALNRVLDDNRELFIPETQTVVKAHPNFMLFATQNPPGLYGGRKTLSRAFKNRFIELHFSEIPRNELEVILEKRCLIPQSYSKKMVQCMWDLQKNRKTTTKNVFTLRDLFRWGNRYTFADKQLLEDLKYDWNQHLIEEGYLVLSAKVRTDIEIEIIEETLYRNFRKKINLDLLFGKEASPVTRSIIDSINSYTERNDIVWTRNMTRMAVLAAKAIQFDEPVLLVGPTGCGKTTVCQILASIHDVNLRILNCHMHTEGADFLGGLRPCRTNSDSDESPKLFEWADGPLIMSMVEGSYFMADEISLAEDSVLERLNCILEPERTVLLAEKGGVSDVDSVSKDFVIKAAGGFQFFATMNPGGDFGKKELSPALRNRFTEIWCIPSDSRYDLVNIAANCMSQSMTGVEIEHVRKIASFLVDVVFYIRDKVEKFKFSIRDVLAWSNYLIVNSNLEFPEAAVFGLETIFLDSLEMLPHESIEKVEQLKLSIIKHAIKQAKVIVGVEVKEEDIISKRGVTIESTEKTFGIKPFFIATNPARKISADEHFLFDAPTTKKNLFRLLSALSLNKPVLLEGPPGVGKTSIVESLAHAIGYNVVRINLCEHTDLADLFGTDLPAEENIDGDNDVKNTIGSFVWRDGPLLAALKSENTWILLDELNLAPQSVLEGLNAILDHRGEVYIPELNKTFILSRKTRIFACQNPLRQGGGRKGLPQSFLNRFNKVYLRKLSTDDLLFVVNGKYAKHFEEFATHFNGYLQQIDGFANPINLFDLLKQRECLKISPETHPTSIEFDLSLRLVKFSEKLDKGIADMEFGYKGGPFEINLRDILRWCDLLISPETGFILKKTPFQRQESIKELLSGFENFLVVLYERMKLIYYQRMRSDQDKIFIRNAFSEVFNCDAEKLNALSEDVSLYWTDTKVYLNDIVLEREPAANSSAVLRPLKSKIKTPLLLTSQRESLKNLIECVYMEKPVLLCGPTDSGKTKLIDLMCTLSNEVCNMDTIDDSVTGSFQQIDLNRHLEEISQSVETIFITEVQNLILETKYTPANKEHRSLSIHKLEELLNSWSKYADLNKIKIDLHKQTEMSDELNNFRNRIQLIAKVIIKLLSISSISIEVKSQLEHLNRVLKALKNLVRNYESLNTGGSFEWVDSKIVKSLKNGQYISLEHVNLCSSAILDRLNPVFEPNGKLLISEKGVTVNDEAEIVDKHENFRAFLTIDPKNGELSRAMRNRCVEIAFSKDNYTQDDLRVIVYESGIRDMNSINTILRIHELICGATEINSFNVSHLTQFAFLVEAYKRIGYDDEKAIYVSGMEVYVYSSNTDLMGYGLAYYQNQLREIVLEESKKLNESSTTIDGGVDLQNVVLRGEDLNSVALVKMQAEPFRLLLKNNGDSLSQLFSSFDNLEYEKGLDLIRTCMYMLYETSSMEDSNLRHLYLNEILQSPDFDKASLKELQMLNDEFYFTINQSRNNFEGNLSSLPWNSKLFPRIREYIAEINPEYEQQGFALSALLLSHLFVNKVAPEVVTKLSQINALAYSQAVQTKVINDRLNNVFLNNLSIFVNSMGHILNASLRYASFNLSSYVQAITAFLWANRMLEISKGKLFIGKVVNTNLMDKLLLHFKWLDKNLLKLLDKLLPNYKQLNAEFDMSLQKIANYALSVNHPLNLIRKIFTKQITQFQPFYSEEQVQKLILRNKLDVSLAIVPVYGSYTNDLIAKKLLAQKSDVARKLKAAILKKGGLDIECHRLPGGSGSPRDIPKPLLDAMTKFINDYAEKPEEEVIDDCEFEEVEKSLVAITSLLNADLELPQLPNKVEFEMMPLREYFLNRFVSQIMINKSRSTELNELFIENISSLSTSSLELLQLTKSKKYQQLEGLFSEILKYIVSIETESEFESLIQYLSVNFKLISTHNHLVTKAVHSLLLNNLSTRSDACLNLDKKDLQVASTYSYNGPPLSEAILKMLFHWDGSFKAISLTDLQIWKSSLADMRQLIWSNGLLMSKRFDLSQSILEDGLAKAKKLCLEVEYVQKLCQNMENENFSDYNDNFQKLVSKLKQQCLKTQTEVNAAQLQPMSRAHNNFYNASLIQSLVGAIELCLLTFTPLIDPVEKNRLKKEYIVEDINCLTTLMTAYDFMKITMNYKNFGSEICNALQTRLADLSKRQAKFSQKVALRPDVCLYSNLVQDITHFLKTNCEPNALHSLLQLVDDSWQDCVDFKPTPDESKLLRLNETYKKIDLWISNSQRFINHTMKRYIGHYEDFLQPLECSVGLVRFGFEGLKVSLQQLQSSIVPNSVGIFSNLNEHGKLANLLTNIVEFPSASSLQVFNVDRSKDNRSIVFSVLDKLEGSEFEYFRLLKSKILELKNRITISSDINEETFNELDFALNICNKVWQDEEERKRKQKAEEDSLYVTKTKCETEDEELIEMQEIEENFPTNVQEDFGEFIVDDSLEKVMKLSSDKKITNKSSLVIRDEDYGFLAQNFIYLMEQFSKVYYYHPETGLKNKPLLDFISPFKDRVKVFVRLFSKYKTALNDHLDGSIYNTFAFAIGLQQEMLNEVSFSSKNSQDYNFYKDSNIPEIISCTYVLDKIETRVVNQLELYPEHASLIDIVRVIKKIRGLPSTSPVVRFNTGFQILRQKVAQWNEVAHKNNHLRDLEIEVAEFVQKWTKLELQFWRTCLSQTHERVQSNAYKYYFFIYNLLQEYIQDHEIDSSYTDMKYTEKRFAEGEAMETEQQKTTKISPDDILRILRQFVESSSYGDFQVRMDLLKSFELYLHYIQIGDEEKKTTLIAGLHNLQIYFSQFSSEIEENKKSIRAPIEKKLKEFVKIESYNKDLSYFSMRSNVARVHRSLNKFLKEYQNQLTQKITPVFQPKDATVKDYSFEKEKGRELRYDPKIKYYMVDVKTFVAPQKLKDKFEVDAAGSDEASLLYKVGKLFLTSRNVVKETISNVAYPNLINALDELMTTQIETCDYLRNLEVDRSQERPKQVLEAKHILQQKRKALSDFFKTLASLGLSYKSGLLEVSLRPEFEDLALPPFCVKTMLGGFKDKKIHPNIVHLNENLDRYYAKCVFKLKLLQNIMLAPLSELGPPNIDRIKGFAVETFLLVQNQRTLLSKSTRNVYELRNIICNLKLLSEMNTLAPNGLKFSKWRDEFVALKESICRVRLLMEQFVLLLKCVPEKESSENTLLVNTNTILVQGEQKFSAIADMCQKLLGNVRSVLSDMAKNDVEFLSCDKMDSFNKAYTDIRFQIEAIRGLLSVSADEYLPAAKSLSELLIHMEQVNKTLQKQEDPSEEPSSFENVDNELENIVHSILLSLQKLFKKYPKQTIITEDGKGQRVSPSKKLAEDEQIQENHLKGKLYQELLADWDILNLSQVTQKMSNILLSIKHSQGAGIQFVRKITSVLPILEQYNLVADYYLFQQLGAHKVSAKMLSVMLTVFVELSTKGFCVPADLMQDEEGESKKNDDKKGEGFGLEDGTGDKDASDKIESEDQLDDAKRPEDRKDDDKKNNEDCKEEKGIDVSDDFEGKMQDIEKPEEEDDSGKSEDEEDLNKEMGDTDKGADKLDDQIWGSDEEQEQSEEENEMEEEDEGKGSKDESDAHNDLDSKNESKKGEDEHDKDGLDATEDPVQDKQKKKQEKDIDEMKEPEYDEEQVNPYHNQLEDPPEAEEMDLGDNVNVDDERDADDQQQDDNPFDIDTMKDLKQPEKEKDEEDEEGEGDGDKDEPGDEDKNEGDSSDSEEEPEAGKDELKKDKGAEDAADENKEEENVDKEDPETKTRGELDEEEQKQQEEDENKESKTEDQDTEAAEESKDKQSKEENVQSVPETENKGSTDQVQSEDLEKDINQDQKLDEQDTGEDKDGVGQAENETSDQGHQGIAETKETEAKSEQSREKPKPEEKRKQGQTNEERTLGEAEKNKLKQLKTIDKLKEQKENAEETGENDEKENEAETEEFQHVKDPKTSDKITLDNATEEQSKQIKHLEDEDKNNDDEEKGDEENTDELMDVDETPNHEEMEQDNEEVSAEKLDNKSDKPSKTEKKQEQSENKESVEVEGDAVETMTVSRGDDTTAHCIKEILMDTSVPQDLTAAETLELRKAYQNQLVSGKRNIPQHEDYEMWQIISNKMLPNARELCEQLRLILEPTKCTRLKGDYRTGRRINMKKIIPYIASQFRKDKIWLRRTKPAQRDYKITIAIDDSKSMDHNNSKELTLEAISLVSQALTLLESGRLSILSFGEAPKIILNHTEQFDGPKLISSLAFSQEKTNIADLLDFVRTVNTEEGSMGSDNGLFENLLLVLSDGRNIFSEGNVKVRNAVKLARRQRIFLVYIIIDNPENKSSILDIQSVEMLPDQKLSIKSYLDDFPFPYYMIVRDLGQLPLVLSEAMRQWFELVNSEQ